LIRRAANRSEETASPGVRQEAMALTPLKVLLFLAGGCTAAAATAYVSDVFNPYLSASLAISVPAPQPAATGADPQMVSLPAQNPTLSVPLGGDQAQPRALPSFDLVRVEGDGSIVVAGKAVPGAKVEIDTGSRIIGSTVAGADGDFAIVIDQPLKPGEYQLVLRSTTPENAVAISGETAVVSIPETEDGQVLVLIEKPGEPSRLVTVPKAMTPDGQHEAVLASASMETPATTSAGEPKVAVEAVEIEGRKVFVAGITDPGRKVRAYINDVLLGEAEASPDGHFLIEAERDLPVGNHIVRVDALGPDRIKVVARAAVPFQREPGEDVAVVAPTEEPASGAAPGALAAKLNNVDSAIIIRRGDTLWQISRRVYGRGVRYSAIYLANQTQIKDPDRIWPGQVFKVPEKTAEGEAANMEAVDAQARTVLGPD
jgi:nucleoid-associated protein YgaU